MRYLKFKTYSNKKINISIAFILMSLIAFGQPPKYKPDVQSLNPSQRIDLQQALYQYITPSLVQQYAQMRDVPDCYGEPNFFAFRRSLINDFEDWLVLNGYGTLVPLAAWDPGTMLPADFHVVDPDCAAVGSSECVTPWSFQPYNRHITLQYPDQCNYNNAIFTTRMRAFPLVGGYDENVCSIMGGNMFQKGSVASPAFWFWNSYLDDVWKEHSCECGNQNPNPKQVDLFMKNSKKTFETVRDIGVEPNLDPITWESPDIWIRNDNAGFTTEQMQNPIYSSSTPRKVYVRVRNKGCNNSNGTEVLKLYWAKAGSYHNWPAPWNGVPVGTPAMVIGGLVGTVTLPVINQGNQKIVEFNWMLPNPSQFGFAEFDSNNDQLLDAWHFCLLARIESVNDPDGVTLVGNNMTNILQQSNNFVLRNFHIIKLIHSDQGGDKIYNGTIAIGNLSANSDVFDFGLEAPVTFQHTQPITDEADVTVTLGESTWQKWDQGGRQGSNIEIYDESTRTLKVTSANASLENLAYDSSEVTAMNLAFNFLTEEVSSSTNYNYRVIQKRHSDQSITGGQTYNIERDSRPHFTANAGYDQTIQDDQSTVLVATDIGEPATYKWLDNLGSLLHTGMVYPISPDSTTNYKLEVTATDDGYRDIDEVKINVKNDYIKIISPNPATGNATIGYKVVSSNQGNLILSQTNGHSETFSLDLSQNSKTVSLTGFTTGLCTVSLQINGQIVDTKTLLIL